MELFRSALAAEPPLFTVLYVHGPGGVGKTTLLHACTGAALDAGRPVVTIDGRDVPPTREAFTAAVVGVTGRREPPGAAALPERAILVVDTCELLAPLEPWLRHTFLPQLPANAIVVLAGRHRPATEWRTDLAWATLTRIVELRNFDTADASAFLHSRGVPSAAHERVLQFTHGHPLALTLMADALAAKPDAVADDPGDAAEVVRQLLAAVVDRVPAGPERDALEISACARVTTEPLLADLLGREAGLRGYQWLQGESFVEHTARGVFPHDLARDVLLADARWRDEPRLRALSQRVYAAVHARIPASHGPERQQLQMDALYITRTQPTHGPFFDWTAMDCRLDAAAPQDGDWIAEVVRRHEGTASAGLARAWWRAQPAAFQVLRDTRDQRFGFLALVELASGPPPVRDDPATSAAMRFVERHRPFARGDLGVYLRWWMHAERYQDVTAAINLTATHVVSQCTTRPNIAWNFVAMADPAFWAPHFEGVNFARVADADFEVGGRRFGVFAHDWRFEPPAHWVCGERTPMPFAPPRIGVAPAPALDEAAFKEAVRLALRDYARPDALGRSALLEARAVRAAGAEPAAALQRLLRESAEALKSHPRDAKLYRAVWHTYFEPLATQEQVAERLDLPFSTYRRHLRQAIDRIAEATWQREQKASRFRSSG